MRAPVSVLTPCCLQLAIPINKGSSGRMFAVFGFISQGPCVKIQKILIRAENLQAERGSRVRKINCCKIFIEQSPLPRGNFEEVCQVLLLRLAQGYIQAANKFCLDHDNRPVLLSDCLSFFFFFSKCSVQLQFALSKWSMQLRGRATLARKSHDQIIVLIKKKQPSVPELGFSNQLQGDSKSYVGIDIVFNFSPRAVYPLIEKKIQILKEFMVIVYSPLVRVLGGSNIRLIQEKASFGVKERE